MGSSEIKELCKKLFPSSNINAKLVQFGAMGELETGESYDHLCLLNMMILRGARLVGGFRILFSSGESADSLCSLRIQLNFNTEGKLSHIIHERAIVGSNKKEWEIDYTHYYSDPEKTEPWLFESKEAYAESLLAASVKAPRKDIGLTHPLLNSLEYTGLPKIPPASGEARGI